MSFLLKKDTSTKFSLLAKITGCLILVTLLFIFSPLEKNSLTGFTSPVQSSTDFREGVIKITSFPSESSNLSIALAVPTSLQLDKLAFQIYQSTKIYTSLPFKTDFSFNAVGLKWREDLPQGTALDFSLRAFDGQEWSSWISLERLGNDLKDGYKAREFTYSQPVIFKKSEALQYQVILKTQDIRLTPTLSEVELIYFDTLEPARGILSEANKFQIAQFTSPPFQLPIITRAQWGADESWRQNPEAGIQWPEEYAGIKAFIIHHTVSSDGGADPMATIRAIYHWHARVLGWGDLGYNYLVNQQGQIYEGRAGGDGVIGGHAYDQARNVGYNRGSIGIALLGDYETRDTPTQLAKEAISQLIAQKSWEFGLVPTSQVNFVDREIPLIIGHKDVDATLCPGQNLYNVLPEIRLLTQQRFLALGGLESRLAQGSFVAQSEKVVSLKKGKEQRVWVAFKNTGNTTWHSYTDDLVYLSLSSLKSKLAQLRIALEGDQVEKTPSQNQETEELPQLFITATEPNVKPGEIGQFTFSLQASSDESTLINKYILVWGQNGWFPGTDCEVTINTPDLDWQARYEDIDLTPAVWAEAQEEVRVKFLNRGAKSWLKNEVTLTSYGPADKASPFRDESWPQEAGGFSLGEEEVKPGEVASFSLTLKNPSPGLYEQFFKLKRKLPDGTFKDIPGGLLGLWTRVDSTYQGQLLSHNIPLAFLNTWRPKITFKIKNTGIETWSQKKIRLLSYALDSTVSPFYDPRDWLSQEVASWMVERETKPGEVGTFVFTLKPPKGGGGVYRHKFVLKLDNKLVYLDGQSAFGRATRVDEMVK